jgi:hypothetical protein
MDFHEFRVLLPLKISLRIPPLSSVIKFIVCKKLFFFLEKVYIFLYIRKLVKSVIIVLFMNTRKLGTVLCTFVFVFKRCFNSAGYWRLLK